MTIKMDLRRKEERKIVSKWRLFIDRMSEPACLLTTQNEILKFNSSFKKQFVLSDKTERLRLKDLFIIPDFDEGAKEKDLRILKGISAKQKVMTEMDFTKIDEEGVNLSICRVSSAQKTESKSRAGNFHQKVLDNLFQEIVVLDTNFNFVYFSSATLKDVELRKWLIGKSDYDYCERRAVDPKVADTRFLHYQEAVDSKMVVDWVEHFPLKDGSVKKMFRKITPVLDETCEVEFLLVNSFFESTQAILNHEYDESRKRFEAMVQHSPDAIVLFDASTKYCLESNNAASELFGIPKAEMLQTNAWDISFHIQPNIEEYESFLNEQFDKAMNYKPHSFKWIVQSKEGQLIPTEVRLVRLPSSGKVLIRASFSDISERLRAEQTQKQYQMLFENSQQGILVYNVSKQQVVSCNTMACSIYGFSKDEFMELPNGHSSPKLQSNGLDSGKLIEKYSEAIFKNGTAQMEIEQLTKDGRIINLAVMGHKLKANEDEVMVSVFIDRTEHVQNREKLKKQAEQFKQFVVHNPSDVAMLDTDMNYILVSKEWVKDYGVEGVDLIGNNHYELHPEIPARWKKGHADALAGKTVRNNNDCIIINGEKSWFRYVVRPWYNEHNEVGGILIYSECITDQVKAELKIRRQGVQFKTVFESSSIGWLECDVENTRKFVQKLKREGKTYIDESVLESGSKDLWPHFKVLSYNKQIREIFGLNKGVSLNELKILSMMKEDAKLIFMQELESMFYGEKSFETEFQIVNLHGEERHIYLSVNYPEDDDYSRVLYSVLDITDLRQSVKALRQSEQRYKSMFEDNRLGVAYTNEEEDYFKVNQAFIKIFGYSQKELVEMNQAEFTLPQYASQTKENYRLLRKSHIRSFNMEKEYYHKDGSIVHANLSVTGLYDFSGHYFGNVAVIEDITEKKNIYAKLNEQNKKLISINKELDRFVYSAAHDLRAPLANVKGLANLIKQESVSDQASNYLDLQLKSIEKLDTFIKSLVDYLKNSRHELRLQAVDFRQSVPDLIDQYRYGETSQNIDFQYSIKQKGRFVTDPRRLEIVMSNLLSNAIRYSDKKKQRQVRIEVEAGEHNAEIAIIDNGIGINADHIGKIFKLFYRSSESSEGTGIGLYLVKETVEKLEGTIEVDSVEGEWTKFTVKLNSFN